MLPILGTDWQKTLWKIVANPTLEVVAAIVLVLFAAWMMVQGETETHHSAFPVPHVKP
jgi:ABC-type nickel/cobalt efflux system permease component RcnA